MSEKLRAALRDQTRRLYLAWLFVGIAVSLLSCWLGAGYAIGGRGFQIVNGWRVLLRFEGGNIRVHGVIMFALGFAIAVQLRGGWTLMMMWTVRVMRTYCILVAVCWVGSWANYGITWGAPAWWTFLAAMTVYLGLFPPGGGVVGDADA